MERGRPDRPGRRNGSRDRSGRRADDDPARRRLSTAAARSRKVLGGPTLVSHVEEPLIDPNVSIHHYGDRRLATAVLLPHDHDGSPLARAARSVRWPACAVRARRSQPLRVVAVVRRSRLRRRRRSTVAARPAAAVSGSAPCTSISPLPCSTIRSKRCRRQRRSTRSISVVSRSAAGASAATSPRSAVMRRPDVFHAAIAGAPVTDWRLYDTHYTERYLGDPTVDDTAYANSSLLPLAALADPPAAVDPRSGRRQRRRRAHPAAVVGAARRRQAARGAAAGRCHPHDAAGGRRREHAAAPTRLPSALTCAPVPPVRLRQR